MKRKYNKSDIAFTSISLFLILTMSYKFAFGSSVYQTGSILGDETSSQKSTSSDQTSTKSTDDSTSTKDQKSTQETSTEVEIKEISTEKSVDETSTKSSDSEKSTDIRIFQLFKETFEEKSTSTDTADEASTKSTNTLDIDNDEKSTATSSASKEVKTETKTVTKIERLFLLMPVEIKTEQVISNTGEIVSEKKTLLGQLLDLFSF